MERRAERQPVCRGARRSIRYDWTNGVNGTGLRYEDIGQHRRSLRPLSAYLPPQSHAAGRFNPTEITFDPIDEIVAFNLFAPRFGLTYDLNGTGLPASFTFWWGISFSPMLRYQQGFPFGRTFAATVPNVGSVRFLAEPLGTRRQDDIIITDLL